MKISRKWLGEYFDKEIPSADELAKGLTFHAFEIEEVIKEGGDEILDVKVLPNRAHDCLSYIGIAREISAIFEIPLKKDWFNVKVRDFAESNEFSVEVKSEKVKRFKTLYLKDVEVKESPKWLKEKIEVMGGKSINNIVDITNFVMFETGQPMHAFDADKIGGSEKRFVVRDSLKGEKIETLDGVDREPREGIILITDGETDTPLGIAGIKGGEYAGITDKTKNIILEAANFDAPTIRLSARDLNIRTDASVRFENGIAPEIPGFAVEYALSLIEENAKGENFIVEGQTDFYPRVRNAYKIGASLKEINDFLGLEITDEEVKNILQRLNFTYEKIESPREKIVDLAKSLLGKPYMMGSSVSYDAPEKFDCASLATYCYSQAGISIPRISIDQYVYGFSVEGKEAEIGDLIFANSGEGKIRTESVEFLKGEKVESGIDHVGIYIGNGEVLHATGKKGEVLVEKIAESESFKNIIGFRKFILSEDGRFVVSVPFWRLDLIAHTAFGVSGNNEDLIEEIGRMYGFENIKSKKPEVLGSVEVEQDHYLAENIRKYFVGKGYSEVYTYAFRKKGEVEIANPIASDKSFLRKDLSEGVKESLELNGRNMPILGLSEVKVFEIGKVFSKEGEVVNICVGEFKKGKADVKEMSLEDAVKEYSISSDFDFETVSKERVSYKAPSQFPFALRDIAVWTPEGTSAEDVLKIIKENAGEYLVRADLFDEFKKDGRTSFAYHLVFQANDKTLTEEGINNSMSKITKAFEDKGFEIR